MSFVDPGATYYEDRYQKRVLNNLQRRARSLGFILHKVEPDTAQADVCLEAVSKHLGKGLKSIGRSEFTGFPTRALRWSLQCGP